MKRILTYLFVFIFMFCAFSLNIKADEFENVVIDAPAEVYSTDASVDDEEESKEGSTVDVIETPVVEETPVLEQSVPEEEVIPSRGAATAGDTKAVETEPTREIVDETVYDVPDHEKTLTDNNDGTYTLSLTVKGETEKIINKVNVIVILDTSGSMKDPAGNTETTYTPTNTDGRNLYGLVNGEYVKLTRSGNSIFGYSYSYNGNSYTGQRYIKDTGNQTRLEAAQAAVNNLAESLLSNNGGDNPVDTVEISLITFSTNSTISQQPTTTLSNFQSVVNRLTANGGTNWEEALAKVSSVSFNDNDQTYVIFVSDGNPTFYSTNAGNNDYNGQYRVYGTGYEEEPNITRSYNAAVDDAKAIVDNGMKFYTIGAYGNVDRMEGLTTSAGAPLGNYFSAANTTQLLEALNKILQDIETAGFGDITINDGTTSHVATSSGVSHLLDVDTSSFKYYKDDVEWTDAPEATLNSDGEVVWDLGDGLLENGVVYKVTFDVWPSQETLDLIADLKNGTISYDELDSEIAKYLVKDGDDYTLKTNTVASLSFTDTRPEGASGSTLYTNPEPVSTSATQMLEVSKEWNNDVDDRAESPVTLNILKDDTEWYSMTLNSENGFKGSANISVGIMTVKNGEVTIKAPGHDFSFGELGSDVYNWELKTEVVHPMLINGELTMLIRKGTTEPTSGEYYKIGDYYYVVGELDEGVAKLTATNDRRSMIDITKTVEYSNNTTTFDDQLFNFEITVNDLKGDKVWFSIKESNSSDAAFVTTEDGLVVTGATAEEKDGALTGYYFVNSGSTFTVSMKAGWNLRIINLLTGSTYTINETDIDSKFEFDKIDYNKTTYVNSDEEEVEYKPTIDNTKVEGEVMSSNLVYSYEYVNKNVVTEIVVTKIWDDNDNINNNRPDDVVLHLNNEVQPTKVVKDDNTWVYTYSNLSVYDSEGKEITYTLTEDSVLGYIDGVVSGNQKDGFTVTNTLETTSATVIKVWDDTDDQDGKRPESLTVTLSNGTEVTLNEENKWTATVQDLPKYQNGEEVEYTWSEEDVDGYKLTDTSVDETITTLTNTHEIEKTKIEITKVWEDESNKEGFRPESIIVELLANGTKVAEATVSGDGNEWTYTFEDLDVYAEGKEIEYTLKEVSVDNYETTVDGYTITNSREVEKTKIEITKVWKDESNKEGFRPESIIVELLANGTKVAEATVSGDGDEWTYTFEDLDVYAGGEKIEYTLNEVSVDNYETTVDGYTITNSREVLYTSVTVTKVWDDNDNQDGIRPDSITVTLSDGTEVTLNEENEWTATVSNLIKYQNGELVSYTWEEEDVEGYELTNTDVNDDVTTFTNTHEVEKISIDVQKVWAVEDEELDQPSSVMIILNADGDKYAIIELSDENNWMYTFTDLPKYENGEEIEYTVEEVEIEGFVGIITGDSENGFVITNYPEDIGGGEDPIDEPTEEVVEILPPQTGIEEGNDYSLLVVSGLLLAGMYVSKKKIYE